MKHSLIISLFILNLFSCYQEKEINRANDAVEETQIRIEQIKNADKIIVIKEGKIIEEGTHNNLIKNKSLYNDLYKLHKIEGKSE